MADKKISQLIGATTPLTGTEELAIVQSGLTVKATAQDVADLAPQELPTQVIGNAGKFLQANGTGNVSYQLVGGTLIGTNYIYVAANGTDTANAAELQAAYTAAQARSPSATNRITIICGPGKYNFNSTAFTMSTQYIDLVSLDSNRSVLFNSANAAGTINITANDVFVKGVDVGTKIFTIATNLNLLKVENCKGGDYSFGSAIGFDPAKTIPGTFIDCVAGNESFAVNGTANGTFINCVAGIKSFGSFGGSGATGIFINCTGGNESFGRFKPASGTFTNCSGGTFSFGSDGTVSGTFSNCTGGESSWISGTGVTGKLYFSRMTSGATAPSPSGSGRIVAFITGQNNFIAQNP